VRRAPYDPDDDLSINVFLYCEKQKIRRAFMNCPLCGYFPCGQLDEQDVGILKRSPLMECEVVGLTEERRRKVILIRKTDGTIQESDIDIDNPDLDQLKDVAEVYVVGKILVPTIVLKPKPKEERDKVIAVRRARKRAEGEG
jgi:hypothetical protein